MGSQNFLSKQNSLKLHKVDNYYENNQNKRTIIKYIILDSHMNHKTLLASY